MKIKRYTVTAPVKGINIRAACVSDLHSRPYKAVLKAVRAIDPDLVFLTGDILEIPSPYMEERNRYALEFLEQVASLYPTYYTFGNHEIYYSHAVESENRRPDPDMFAEYTERIKSFGIKLINDRCEQIRLPEKNDPSQPIYVGGIVCGHDTDPESNAPAVNREFLDSFSDLEGYKILLCHYPHYYHRYVREKNVDLTLSGHAHGGQWRIFGRGVYAPHQGLFPKYTSGIHENRLIINRGSVNNASPIPRFFNPCEVLELNIVSEK